MEVCGTETVRAKNESAKEFTVIIGEQKDDIVISVDHILGMFETNRP